MMIDTISNAGSYTHLVKHLGCALQLIGNNTDLPPGRYEFEGGYVVSTVGTSTHFSQKEFEVHRSYADVMFVLEHDETVGYCPTAELTCTAPYDEAADCALYSGGTGVPITLPKGYFYVMMPGEAHKPCIHLAEAKPFRKYIIKCLQD